MNYDLLLGEDEECCPEQLGLCSLGAGARDLRLAVRQHLARGQHFKTILDWLFH